MWLVISLSLTAIGGNGPGVILENKRKLLNITDLTIVLVVMTQIFL